MNTETTGWNPDLSRTKRKELIDETHLIVDFLGIQMTIESRRALKRFLSATLWPALLLVGTQATLLALHALYSLFPNS